MLNRWLNSLKLDYKKELETGPIHIHIDDLIGEHSKEIMFFKSLELFYDLLHLDFKINIHKNYVPSLIINLISSRRITYTLRDRPWEAMDIEEQPGIYLIPKPFFITTTIRGI